MYYVLNFFTHRFTTCSNADEAIASINKAVYKRVILDNHSSTEDFTKAREEALAYIEVINVSDSSIRISGKNFLAERGAL